MEDHYLYTIMKVSYLVDINKIIFLYIFSIFSVPTLGFDSDSIIFKIKTDSVIIESGNIFKIDVLIANQSNSTLILYAFNYIEGGNRSLSNYCNLNNCAGSAFILEKNNRQYFTDISLSDEYEEVVDEEYLKTFFKKEKQTFRDTKLVLGTNDSLEYELRLSLKTFSYLYPGTYTVQLVYVCGNNLENMVDNSIQSADCKKYNAKLFKGWLVSNKIKLILNQKTR